MIIAVLFISFALLLVLGVPLAFAMGLSAIAAIVSEGGQSLLIIPQRITASLDSFALLAVPLFILAGELMNSGGITERIVRFSRSAIGHFKGGLAQANILSNMFMAALSGSSLADLSAIGSMMIPAMTKQGYSKPYSVAITSCAALMAPIIPPSIIAVIYGSITGISIGSLFLAGALPGIMAGLGIMVIARLMADKGGATAMPRESWGQFARVGGGALPAMAVPFIIVGGILSGVFTPTEAGAVAVAYALIFGLATRRHRPGGLYALLLNAGVTTASALITLAGASLFSYVLVSSGFAQSVLAALVSLTETPSVAILLIFLLLVVLGMFVETVSALILVVPILIPVVGYYDFNGVQFGIFTLMSLVLGGLTPPVGILAMVACRIADVDYSKTFGMLMPFILWWAVATLLVAYVPFLTTWLPSLVF
ncbi:TRAP transporter large permease [Roseisalinus antarcticus]|uniref:TRAP transporter large permease protein n=1 Tax=Roseisalinus antarcticus TaxID=254357 RepID=A0A1Y5THV5_9RHOB|nr:TRAP transporter large permease [Roseisalinus antarcticus]SLN64649.1 Sialic acid TRAP transporter permease protein SiaT [Roseisalinus antarcticus]